MKLCYENSHSYNKDYASCLMNFEIATLFIRLAIKHSFQKNFLLHCLPKGTRRSWEKEFPFHVARVSEIGILFIRFAIKHSFQKNSLLHWLQKRILIFGKEFPILMARVSDIAILFIRFAIKHSLQKNSLLHCLLQEFSFLRKEFPILVARISCMSLDSPWKNHNKTILVMIILGLKCD